MHRILRFFRARSCAILLFHVGVLLFNWPILSMPSESGDGAIFTYLLIAWAIIVGLLVIMGESIRRTNLPRSGE